MTWLSDDGPWIFLVLTVILGGGAAFLAGRGLARSWKPLRRIFFYMALLAAAVRFFHYALGEGNLRSLYYYLVTYVLLVGAAWLGFRMKVWDTGADFQATLLADKDVTKALSPDEIKAQFDLGYHTKHVDTIFARVFGTT